MNLNNDIAAMLADIKLLFLHNLFLPGILAFNIAYPDLVVKNGGNFALSMLTFAPVYEIMYRLK